MRAKELQDSLRLALWFEAFDAVYLAVSLLYISCSFDECFPAEDGKMRMEIRLQDGTGQLKYEERYNI